MYIEHVSEIKVFASSHGSYEFPYEFGRSISRETTFDPLVFINAESGGIIDERKGKRKYFTTKNHA